MEVRGKVCTGSTHSLLTVPAGGKPAKTEGEGGRKEEILFDVKYLRRKEDKTRFSRGAGGKKRRSKATPNGGEECNLIPIERGGKKTRRGKLRMTGI